MAKFTAQGMSGDEAKAKAEAESPLMQEAREMLVKWEAGDPEVRGLWEMMNNWVYAGFDETYKKMGVGFDKIYYESVSYTHLDVYKRQLYICHRVQVHVEDGGSQ